VAFWLRGPLYLPRVRVNSESACLSHELAHAAQIANPATRSARHAMFEPAEIIIGHMKTTIIFQL